MTLCHCRTLEGAEEIIRSDKNLEDLARLFRTRIQGWIIYYVAFYKSALYPVLQHLDRKLARWATRKFKLLPVTNDAPSNGCVESRSFSPACSRIGA